MSGSSNNGHAKRPCTSCKQASRGGAQRSPIQQAIRNYCKSVAAGSDKARARLRGFVSDVIRDPGYDASWQIMLGNSTNEYINASNVLAVCDAADVVRIERSLRWHKFKARLGCGDKGLRESLQECVNLFGDRYLCFLASRIADTMANVVG